MFVIFDIQHGRIKNGVEDKGASFDINNDGKKEYERDLVKKYVDYAASSLEDKGIPCEIIYTHENYSTRQKRCIQKAKDNRDQFYLYIACHLNAGQGNYAVFIHDERSSNGKKYAQRITDSFKKFKLTQRSLCRFCNTDDWSRAYYCIKGIWSAPSNMCAVLLEPAFLDNPDHFYLLNNEEGLKKIAKALVEGILSDS